MPYAAYRYNWPNAMMGVSLMVVGIGSVVVQMFLVRRVVARFGGRGALCFGLLFGAIGFTLYGLAPTGWWFLCAIPVFSLMGLVGPGVQSLMSRRIAPTEQGRLQGANGSVMAIANMTGPILFTEIFARSIGPWSAFAPVGLPFFVAAALLTTALGLAVETRRAGEEKSIRLSARPRRDRYGWRTPRHFCARSLGDMQPINHLGSFLVPCLLLMAGAAPPRPASR